MQHWFGKAKRSRTMEGIEAWVESEERFFVHPVIRPYQHVV
jgi:hypothetical protein